MRKKFKFWSLFGGPIAGIGGLLGAAAGWAQTTTGLQPTLLRVSIETALEAGQAETPVAGAEWAGLRVSPNLTQILGEEFLAHVEARMWLQVGNLATTAQWDEFKPRRDLDLQEASLVYRPGWLSGASSSVSLTGGVLSQRIWNTPLLFGQFGFPGARESWKVTSSPFELRIDAQQALPTGVTSGYLAAPNLNGLMFLERATLTASLGALKSSVWAGHFAFQSIGPGMAGQAAWNGNTLAQPSMRGSALAELFEGIETGGRLSVETPYRLAFRIEGEAIWNLVATQSPQRALRFAAAADVGGEGWGKSRFRFSPACEWFGVERDAVPALYNPREYGHTNRRGIVPRLTLDWQAWNLQAEGRVFLTEIIEQNPLQGATQDVWTFEVRKSYEIL